MTDQADAAPSPQAAASSDTHTSAHSPVSAARLWGGFGWGVAATVAMSIPMMIGMASGVAPMPEPIPRALVTLVVGTALPAPLLMALSAGSHLAYGGTFGAVLVRLFPNAGVGQGIGMGLVLWFVMQIAVLPLLGWGMFGTGITPKIAVATLVLHLIYGATLGWGLGR